MTFIVIFVSFQYEDNLFSEKYHAVFFGVFWRFPRAVTLGDI